MKKFEYVIKDEVGIHARPAGLLVKEANKYQSKVSITKDGKSAEATKLMALMGLGVLNLLINIPTHLSGQFCEREEGTVS